MEFESCRICKCALNFDTVNIGPKGVNTLISVSATRKDGLFSESDTATNLKLHVKCRAIYINEKSVAAAVKKKDTPSIPASHQPFDYQKQCFFCTEDASEAFVTNQKKKPTIRRVIVHRVLKTETKENILKSSFIHDDDPWSNEVRERIQCVDLVSLNARYHQSCFSKFFLPTRSTSNKRGRPEWTQTSEQMEHIYKFVESNLDDSQFSIQDIKDELAIDLPSEKTIKRKLIERYGDKLTVIDTVGNPSIFCFITTSQKILHDQWYTERQSNPENERARVVRTAANIVLEDIRSRAYETKFYPAPTHFLQDVKGDVPDTLDIFLKIVISKYKKNANDYDRKVNAIAHTIISAARPRSFRSPLLLGISSMIHQKYASKTLIDLLSSLGFCESYGETNKFVISTIFHPPCQEQTKNFTQYVFDNADFNAGTLDGNNTFHSMGGIKCSTPKSQTEDQPIEKLKSVPKRAVLGKYGNTPLTVYQNEGKNGLANFRIKQLTIPEVSCTTELDSLWLYAKSEYGFQSLIPGWNSFLGGIRAHEQYSTTDVVPLPFINNPPSDYNTVYTSLIEASSNCEGVCVVTFDQPLYLKAQEVIHTATDSRLKRVLPRLGGFHLLMSFMGAIGYLMSGSGLKELWCIVYAALSTEKMLTGHSYARAVRAHFLTRCALFNIIINTVELTLNEKLDIEELLHDYDISNVSQNLKEADILKKFQKQLDAALEKIESWGPTAKLWITYFRMTSLIAKFIEAEKSGNWNLHIETIKEMMPYFHASGHFAYAKCCQMYIQDMENLEEKMSPDEIEKFVGLGYFTIRRTDKFWSGIWTDQTIEQTLMRTMKVSGGLTHGRGLTDGVLAKWILAMPTLNRISDAIETYCDIYHNTSDQHSDARDSRNKKDIEDIKKLDRWFAEHDPFPCIDNIVSLSSGIVGNANINCHKALDVGKRMMAETVGKSFQEVSYKRKNRALPLSAMTSAIKIDGVETPIDPDIIFRRICFTKKSQEELKSFFTYELAPFPLSLFDEKGMRKTNKSALYDIFVPVDDNDNLVTNESYEEVNEDSSTEVKKIYVIDGGFLLHKVVWQKDLTVNEICNRYVTYVKRHYSKAVVIFDGYDKNTTKEAERSRRSRGQVVPDVIIERHTIVTTPQEKFLSNSKNKERLISHLRTELSKSGVATIQSEEDADTLIIHTAIEEAEKYDKVVIVGNDIDLLVILCGSTEKTNILIMKPGQGKIPTKFYSVKSITNQNVRHNILFIHAISGCDTTSALFGQGKKKICNLIKNTPGITQKLAIFKNADAESEALIESGQFFLSLLYGGDTNISLNEMRYKKFAKSTTKSKYNLACLPPSCEAAKQHIFRVYHQVQKWLGNNIAPNEWGWELKNNQLEPVKTTAEAAPKEILELISCKCKKSCSKSCTCKKAGMKCSVLCTNCDGKNCHDFDDTVLFEEVEVTFQSLTGCDHEGFVKDHEETDENDIDPLGSIEKPTENYYLSDEDLENVSTVNSSKKRRT